MTAYLITVAIIGIVIILIAAKLRMTAQIVQFCNYQNPRGFAPMHAISKHVWQTEMIWRGLNTPLTKTCVIMIIEDKLCRVGSQEIFRVNALCYVGGAAMGAMVDPTSGPELTNDRMFQPGDPIRLSKLGESRMKRAPSKTGRVLRGTGSQRSSQNAIRVQFDGMKYPVSLHLSYIELLDAKDTTNEGEMKAR